MTALSDVQYMEKVLSLAEKGTRTTQPNPRVGCLIVNDGEIVGSGYHHSAGELHAERLALADAGEKARGATAFVNLEPCCHQGRTPPCTDALIDAGVSRVVAAISDPNPRVSGSGFELLANAGIEVKRDVLKEQSLWLNRGFVSRMARKRPWVKLKSGATLDGRTAAFDGTSKWITGNASRQQVQALRAECSAIVTGVGTVLADDPNLNVREHPDFQIERQPLRVVLDSQLQTPLDSRIIGADQRLVVFTLSDEVDKSAALIEQGAEVIKLDQPKGDQLDLKLVLRELAKWECNEVLIEAGQTLSGAFLQKGLVDELILYYAGSLLGDQGKSMFQFDQALEFENRPEFKIRAAEMVGNDVKVTAHNEASLKELDSI